MTRDWIILLFTASPTTYPLCITTILEHHQKDKLAVKSLDRASLRNDVLGGGFHYLNRWAIQKDGSFFGILDMVVTEYE